MTTDVEQPAASSSNRGALWFAALALIGLALLAATFFLYRSGASDRDAKQDSTISALKDQSAANADDARALAEQVRQLGAEPVVQPPPASGDRGADGTDGRNGVDGRDGKDGKDGTGPACLTEPAQCRGADGRDGVDGADGAAGQDGAAGANGQDGANGQNGSPPAGWTWVDGEGRTQSCSRDGGTDAAPHYACTTEPPPETVPGLPLTIGG